MEQLNDFELALLIIGDLELSRRKLLLQITKETSETESDLDEPSSGGES
jgi:hypothetical protein